ncbi:hypothetical protein BU14_0070s0063 [Porphyra umbilicalis]|uniref:Uncharacterized protein n=1 Tax=Porphyra umbilicalis TaxID=2786 RepID=A0A1X6PGG9_PORUM|nr:hypothetical protein BU14_0070s0063 [Porphyra umbilicalis]|eukprot:OSX79888.1 hypothetical protein BU14_0070s0063 [Porphyra umbilicalis]
MPPIEWHVRPATRLQLRKIFHPFAVTRLSLGVDVDARTGGLAFRWSWKDRLVGGRLSWSAGEVALTKRFPLGGGGGRSACGDPSTWRRGGGRWPWRLCRWRASRRTGPPPGLPFAATSLWKGAPPCGSPAASNSRQRSRSAAGGRPASGRGCRATPSSCFWTRSRCACACRDGGRRGACVAFCSMAPAVDGLGLGPLPRVGRCGVGSDGLCCTVSQGRAARVAADRRRLTYTRHCWRRRPSHPQRPHGRLVSSLAVRVTRQRHRRRSPGAHGRRRQLGQKRGGPAAPPLLTSPPPARARSSRCGRPCRRPRRRRRPLRSPCPFPSLRGKHRGVRPPPAGAAPTPH